VYQCIAASVMLQAGGQWNEITKSDAYRIEDRMRERGICWSESNVF